LASLQLLSSGTHLPLVFVREQAGERLLVALSPAAGEATFELPPDCMPGESLLAHRARVAAEAGTARLLLDGPAAGIWRLQEGTPSRDAGRTLGAPSRTTTR
jgi:hypothetical protein